jgi:S1-C subfamily serine protease
MGLCVMTSPTQIDLLLATVALIHPVATGQASQVCRLGSATGLFFQHDNREFLVTNRHVIIDEERGSYPDHLVIRVHASKTNVDLTRNIEAPLYDANKNPLWLEHQAKTVDLAAVEIGDLIEETDLIEYWKLERFLPDDVRVDVGAELLVVGYPMEFYDTKHNLPIVRSGTLATTYGTAFLGQPLFLADANLHPGTSGSPVVSPRSTLQRTVSGDIRMGTYPPYLLGVNSGEYGQGGVRLGLNAVWYARLILDIVRRQQPASPPEGNTNVDRTQ